MAPLLLFSLDDLRFALPLEQVREMVRAVAITPLSGAPGVVEGIVDIRGTVMPVLDLRARFGLPRRPVALTDHMILAESGAREVILRVDRVLEPYDVGEELMTPAPQGDPAFAHLAGVARLADGLVLIQDLERFMTQGEMAALAAAMEREGTPAGALPGQGAPRAGDPQARTTFDPPSEG